MALLTGIRIIDFTAAVAGPYCTQLLGDLGAEIIKVEPPRGDQTRNWGTDRIDGMSFLFMSVNRNKQSVVVDLKNEADRSQVHKLIATADVVVESFAPGGPEKLGVDYETCRKLRPNLVYCSISGYGRSGPRGKQLGMDMMLQASSGIMSFTGEADRPPVRIPVSSIDLMTGSLAFGSVLAALRARDQDGTAQYVELSLYDTAMNMLGWAVPQVSATGREPSKMGGEYEMAFPYGMFKASDDYFYLGVSTAAHWQRFCQALKLHELENDPRFNTNEGRLHHRDELRVILAKVFTNYTAAEIEGILRPAKLAVTRMSSVADAIKDEHAIERASVRSVPGFDGVLVPSTPFRMPNNVVQEWTPPPKLGQHTAAVFDSLNAAGVKKPGGADPS